MLLGVAVVHYREERLPHGRDEVFRALCEAVLELRFRSDRERRRQTARLTALALAIHERGEREVARPVFEGLLVELLTAEQGRAPSGREVEACCDLLLGVCGLLQASDRSVRFIHLGFQEFLAATAPGSRMLRDYSA